MKQGDSVNLPACLILAAWFHYDPKYVFQNEISLQLIFQFSVTR